MFKLYPKNNPGDIIEIAVYDCFEGRVRLLEQTRDRIHIEIVDVCMCYPCQVQSVPGERYWIHRNEIYGMKPPKVDLLIDFIKDHLPKRKRELDDLPF